MRPLPIGSRIVDGHGYWVEKVASATGRRWERSHVVLWERANGKIPAGHRLTFVNGDRKDLRLENLRLISGRESLARSSFTNYPPELRSAMRAINKLRRAIGEKQDNGLA